MLNVASWGPMDSVQGVSEVKDLLLFESFFDGVSVGSMRIPGGQATVFESEFRLHFSDPHAEPVFDLCDSLALSAKMASFIEVLQVSPQLLEKLVGKTVAHRKTILPQI